MVCCVAHHSGLGGNGAPRSMAAAELGERPLPNVQQFVRLKAQAPLRMGEAVAQGRLGVGAGGGVVAGVERLKKEGLELQMGEALWLSLGLRLWVHELELISPREDNGRRRLWADADVVEAGRRFLRPVRLARDLAAAPG